MPTEISLADSIRANTAAVQALTGSIERIFGARIFGGMTIDVPVVDARAADDAAAEDEAFAAISAKTEKSISEVAEPTLAEVKAAAIALAKKDREALAAALAKFNAPKVVDLKPTQFAAFLTEIA